VKRSECRVKRFFYVKNLVKYMEPVSTNSFGLTALLKFYGAAIIVTLAVALVAVAS
jgi:hypothetical protein